jgi:YidC/Oxa1 family membrane protein insertase
MLITANIFQPLIDVFEAVLKFFHDSVGVSWGWSIVLLTICVRAVLVPLTVKQFHSMQRLQQHTPELKAIQARYKDDKQRQQQEMMKFYRENKINPAGACLPLAAQLPVFISLFYMLRSSLRVDICPAIQRAHQGISASTPISHAHTVPCGSHGAGFLFIPDLTDHATGAVLIVLIILYVGTQLASSLLMSSPTMDKTQRQIMLFMPLFFVIFIISFPAGVLVYWITTNTWTIGQQYFIKRRIGPMGPPATATAGDGPTGPGGSGGSGGRGGGGSGGSGPNGGSGPDGAGGGGSGGGLGALIRQRVSGKQEESGVATKPRPRTTAPPPPPRKKKKRSGRRR